MRPRWWHAYLGRDQRIVDRDRHICDAYRSTYSGANGCGRRSRPNATYGRLASVTLTQITSSGLRCAYASSSTVIEGPSTYVISGQNKQIPDLGPMLEHERVYRNRGSPTMRASRREVPASGTERCPTLDYLRACIAFHHCPPQISGSTSLGSCAPTNYALAGAAPTEYS
jgi:hypothetical protein